MAQGNGKLDGIAALALPTGSMETSPLHIGGQDVQVPVLMLWDLERLRVKIDSIQGGMDWIEYAKTVLRIAAQLISPDELHESEATYVVLLKACSIPEMRSLGDGFNKLLGASGFTQPGEAEAATEQTNPGTGMSTESPLT